MTKTTARKAATPKAPDPTATAPTPPTKISSLVDLLRRQDGATIEAMMHATGWQAHSVRGAIAGAIKKGLGLEVISEKIDGIRVYRVSPEVAA